MSTKVSLFYEKKIDVHIYYEQMDSNYYMETNYGTVLLTEGIAKALADKLNKFVKKNSSEVG